ncbi:hypothetical protein [Synechocystis sp. PCC 7509]|uniref:hypothetical protein n=1 Tax=Synechocystis sp. PCC 7509 TaxID=927677 RepID=UPI0002ABBB7C|nr:hypothetical protein [Synechocystis sp. PCC 7509]
MLYKTSFVWFRFFRRKTYPWVIIAIASSKVICSNGTEKTKEQVRLMVTLAKIDFVKIYGFMNDLLW